MFKKILFSLFLIGALTSHASASPQVISSGTGSNWTNSQYLNLFNGGGLGPSATQSLRQQPVASSGTFSKFYCRVNTAPGAGNSVSFTLDIAGSPTSLVCAISGTSLTGSDTSNTAAVTAGQLADIAISQTGTPTAGVVQWSLLFDGTTSNESIVATGHDTNLSTSAVRYAGPAGRAGVSSGTTEGTAEEVLISTGGTIKNLYVVLGATLSSGSYTFAITKNGTPQSLTCQVTGSTCSDTSNSFPVVAGDYISIKSTPASASTATTLAAGLTFVSTTNGEFILPFRLVGGTLSNTNTEYFNMSATAQTAENIRYALAQSMTVKNIYALLATDPGGAANRAFTLRTNGTTNTAETVTISAGSTAGNYATDVTINNGDFLSMKSVPTSTPAVSGVTIAMTGYIAPPASGYEPRVMMIGGD